MSKLKFPHASGNSMSIAAPSTNPASDLELKLPATIGIANQFLKNSGTAGTLGWSSVTEDSGTVIIKNADGDSNGLRISQESSDESRIYNYYGGSLTFGVGNTERMRIDSSGRLLIGTTSLTPNPGITLLPAGTIGIGNNAGVNTQSFIEFRRSGTQIGSITQSGTTGIAFNTSSDYRLKENATAISDGITRLKTLKPYRFNWKAEPSINVDGFFAHEVTAVPEAIVGTKDKVDEDNKPIYQQIDQSKLVPLLTAALQEAITKIETLETKVAALEAA